MESTAKLVIDNAAPIGYAINRGGPPPGGLDTKSQVWGLVTDWHDPDCLLCLVKVIDDSPMLIRYRKRDIVITKSLSRYDSLDL